MLNLQELIDAITFDTNLKVCVNDISGLLMNDKLKINSENRVHYCAFCNAAKSTPNGYKLCIACKNLANLKAIRYKEPFFGFCPWGIFEAVYPVVIKNAVYCIVYVGNALPDKSIYKKRSDQACKITSVDNEALYRAKSTCEENVTKEKIIHLAKIIGDYIVLLSDFYMYDKLPLPTAVNRVSIAVKEYVKLNFRQPLTLGSLSKIYFVNEKYLGRIFAKTWNMSFHEYLNEVRLINAAKLLRTSKMTVTEIAMDSGFENVTYFNRVFRKKYGKTPTEYRREEL